MKRYYCDVFLSQEGIKLKDPMLTEGDSRKPWRFFYMLNEIKPYKESKD